MLTHEEEILFGNALTLVAISTIFLLGYTLSEESGKEKLAKIFLILSTIFFAPDAIFIILKAISAFIYMVTIYWK